MGQPIPVDPAEAIIECICIAAGEVRYASERIAALGDDDAVGPVVTTHERPRKFEKGEDAADETVTETKHEAPAVHIWIDVRHKAMDRLVNYSAIALKAGVEDRRVKLAEQQGQLFADAIRRILEALGVADRPEVPAIVRRELTLIAGGAA